MIDASGVTVARHATLSRILRDSRIAPQSRARARMMVLSIAAATAILIEREGRRN